MLDRTQQTRRLQIKSHICALMLFGILGVTPLCYAQTENPNTSIGEVKKETQDFLHIIGSYTADKRDEAVQKAQEGLYKLEKRIDALEARIDNNWNKMNEATRNETRENLRALRKQQNQLTEWYGGMKTSSADGWDHMKKGFSDAYQVLEDAWEKSEKEFRPKE